MQLDNEFNEINKNEILLNFSNKDINKIQKKKILIANVKNYIVKYKMNDYR